MTTGEKLSSISSVSNVPAIIHLMNVTGGSGIDRFFPYTDMTIHFAEQDIVVDFEEDRINVNFETQDIVVDFEEDNFKVTFDDYNLDINMIL